MSDDLIRALLTIGFASLAGGVTNSVAVWMLFHPYRPVRIGGLQLPFLHGAIPKNQDRLADAVGRTVGERLLTEEDLTRIFSNPEFRAAFDARLGAFLETLLERERGTVRDLIPPEALREVEALLDAVAAHLADRLESWLDSPALEAAVEERVDGLLGRLADEPVAAVLTPDRERAFLERADGWLREVVEKEGFHRTVDDYLRGTLDGILRADRTFEDVLPSGLAATLENALARFLPVAARRLGGVLEDPEARSRLERTLRELFQRFLRDLRFHQRVVARLVVTDETLDRVLATLEEEGSERLSEMLRDPAVQEAIARRVNDGVVELLRTPVTEVIGHPTDPGVVQGRKTVSGWIVGMARDEAPRRYLLEKLERATSRMAAGSWGDVLRSVPRDRVAAAVAAAARSEAARRGYREVLRRTLDAVLDRPLGRPGDWLPAGAARRVQGTVSEPLWRWLQAQVPQVVRTLDVRRRIEEKVRAYPVERMEELVRRVTSRELRLIVRLGYLLGAVIGTALVGANALLG